VVVRSEFSSDWSLYGGVLCVFPLATGFLQVLRGYTLVQPVACHHVIMERDTIAQRISALRKEVFLVPPSHVSDPQRKVIIPPGCIPGSAVSDVDQFL
jgi:hypothetical protein